MTPRGRWRRIELTIVVEGEVKPWRFPPSFDFQYGDWLRREFESGNAEPWPTTVNPDLAVLLTMVLLADEPLIGPPPAEILDPVPHRDRIVGAAEDALNNGFLARERAILVEQWPPPLVVACLDPGDMNAAISALLSTADFSRSASAGRSRRRR